MKKTSERIGERTKLVVGMFVLVIIIVLGICNVAFSSL